MLQSKNFLVLCAFSLLLSMTGANGAGAYTITLKPKFQCEDGKLMLQGSCVDSNSEAIIQDPEDNDPTNADSEGWIYALSNKLRFGPSMTGRHGMGMRGVYAAKHNRLKKWA